jgi:hypothetical protein
MRCHIVAAVALVILATSNPTFAQNCYTVRATVYCDNGLSGSRVGNTTYWNDGVTSNRVGSKTTYATEGSSANTAERSKLFSDRVGGTTYFSNGRSCTRIGSSFRCY